MPRSTPEAKRRSDHVKANRWRVVSCVCSGPCRPSRSCGGSVVGPLPDHREPRRRQFSPRLGFLPETEFVSRLDVVRPASRNRRRWRYGGRRVRNWSGRRDCSVCPAWPQPIRVPSDDSEPPSEAGACVVPPPMLSRSQRCRWRNAAIIGRFPSNANRPPEDVASALGPEEIPPAQRSVPTVFSLFIMTHEVRGRDATSGCPTLAARRQTLAPSTNEEMFQCQLPY